MTLLNVRPAIRVLSRFIEANPDCCPDLIIDPNQSLGNAALACASKVSAADIIDFLEKFTEQLNAIDSKDFHNEIQRFATAFSELFMQGIADVKYVHGLVDSVSQSIQNNLNQQCEEDPVLVEAKKLNFTSEVTYPVYKWNYLKTLGPEQVIVEQAYGIINAEPKVDRNKLRNFSIALTNEIYKLKKLDLDGAQLQKIATTIAEVAPDYDPAYNADLLEFLKQLNKGGWGYKLKKYFIPNSTANVYSPPAPIIDTIDEIAWSLPLWVAVMNSFKNPALSNAMGDVPERWTDIVPTMERILWIVGGILVTWRRTMLKDIAFFNNSKLNNDLVKELEANGITTRMIANLLIVLYGGDRAKFKQEATTGLSIATLKNSPSYIDKEVKNMLAKRESVVAMHENTYMRRAIDLVLRDFINDNVGDEGFHFESKLTKDRALFYMEQVIRNVTSGSMNLTAALYQWFFKVFHINMFSRLIYDKLGQNYINLISESDSIDEEGLVSMEAMVVTELITIVAKRTFVHHLSR